jgi:hypothetical protein
VKSILLVLLPGQNAYIIEYKMHKYWEPMVLTHFQIERIIVEDEQGGQTYASYEAATIKNLSSYLTKIFGRGFSTDNLENMKAFYLEYRNSDALRRISNAGILNSESVIRNLQNEFGLSWTHYLQLLKNKDKQERQFYRLEAVTNNRSVRELQRQIGSSLFERLALSRDKKPFSDLHRKDRF